MTLETLLIKRLVAAADRIWQNSDSHGQILALTFSESPESLFRCRFFVRERYLSEKDCKGLDVEGEGDQYDRVWRLLPDKRLTPRPESGLDCLICGLDCLNWAGLTRQRRGGHLSENDGKGVDAGPFFFFNTLKPRVE